MKIDDPTNQAVKDFFGKDPVTGNYKQIILNIPYLKDLFYPGSFITWIISIIAILPWIVSIVCVFVILLNAIKWVKSSGNEKEIESAKTGIRRALVGFASMFVIIIISNIMSFIILGVNLEKVAVALSPCYYTISTSNNYNKGNSVIEYSRDFKLTFEQATKACGY